ncbi:MAG TPA: glycoside-pentoside-hexuronide (GPH):cation symporter [Steroidobacteraceae bacterium]|nr:glycoside-pentoside-hexuronide (GPH):cation symporter [Steroidobacteraceae bacterium]
MTVNAAAAPVLGLREKICYGLGDFSSNLLWGISGGFLMYYYTDTLRLAAADLAVLLLVTRVFDALADPTVGYLIDRSSGRLVRPLIKWLAVPFGCVAFLVFLPISEDSRINLAWAYVSYLLFGLIYAAINTPYGILQNIITTDTRGRVSLAAFRMVGCQLGTLSVYALTIPAVHWLGGGSLRENELVGFPIYMAIIGGIGATLWYFTYSGCRVRYTPEPQRHTIKELLQSLSCNPPWLICTAAFSLSFVILCAYLSFAIYYARYVLHQDAQFGGYLLMLFTVCSLIGNVSSSKLTRFERKKQLQVGYFLQALALAVIGAFPGNLTVFVPGFVVVSCTAGIGSPLYYTMVADSIDYGTRTTGVRTAGMGYSLNSLLQKASFGVTGALLAEFLSLGGYAPGAVVQNPQLSTWITAGFIWMPAVMCLLLIPLISRYPAEVNLGEAALLGTSR